MVSNSFAPVVKVTPAPALPRAPMLALAPAALKITRLLWATAVTPPPVLLKKLSDQTSAAPSMTMLRPAERVMLPLASTSLSCSVPTVPSRISCPAVRVMLPRDAVTASLSTVAVMVEATPLAVRETLPEPVPAGHDRVAVEVGQGDGTAGVKLQHLPT